MQEYGITRQKLFTLSRQTIEKRIRKFYHETKDGTATIELLIALQVRAELCESEFKSVLRELHFLKNPLDCRDASLLYLFYRLFWKERMAIIIRKIIPSANLCR